MNQTQHLRPAPLCGAETTLRSLVKAVTLHRADAGQRAEVRDELETMAWHLVVRTQKAPRTAVL
jgi:hypothetical protein